ncbi:MAG: TonB family protein, partial [Candidatus Aminicenantes bacterium]|nr:TonB family protein [Candidatus Aminicenantes bacterium]
ILLIDFDSEFIKFLSQHLQKDGYEVITANDGVSGFEKFSEHAPDLVIMEAMLPKFHGFELCSRITSHPTKKSPVIIVTGIYKDVAYKSEALKNLGASAYFEKPVNLEELMKKVYELVGLPASTRPDFLYENVDDLLKSALSIENEKSPAKTSSKEPVRKKPESPESDLDKLLETKLKDLITEKIKVEEKSPSSATTRPVAPSEPLTKKQTSAETVSEPIKTAVKPQQPTKPQTKEIESQTPKPKEPLSVIPEVKKETSPEPTLSKDSKDKQQVAAQINEPLKTKMTPISSPFDSYLKSEEEEKETKKGAGKFIGLALGLILVIALVGFLVFKKKETPTFSAQKSDQTAAIQTVSTEQAKKEAVEQNLDQDVEKQIVEFKNQKPANNNRSQAAGNKNTKKVEAPVVAAPITPKETPSLALHQPSASTSVSSQNEEPKVPVTSNENQTEEKKINTSEQTPQALNENSQGVIPTTKVKTGDLVPLNMVDVEPKIVKTVEPVYPEVDRRMGIKGNVLLNVLISETGEVLEAVVIRGIKGSVSLEKEAINAVKKWKFLPAEKDGVKVRVWKPITIGFGLNK